MGALQTVAMLVVLLPGAGLLGLIWRGFLSGHDINYYLSSKPPAFLAACALGGLVGLAVLAVVVTLYVRWILAVPILLFEGARPFRSLRESSARVRGSKLKIAAILVAWHAGMLGLSALLFALFRFVAAKALDAAGTGVAAVATVLALLLLAQAILGALLTFLAAAGHALIVFRLYVLARPAGETAAAPSGGGSGESAPGVSPGAGTRSMAPLWGACAFILLIVVGAGAVVLPRFVSARPVEITAHRGCSRVAPENSLSAFRKAIEAGADWAELDVQETADNVIVVMHDRDLMRMAGDPRRVSDLTLAELKTVDIGSKFSPEFAGERVPTLKEVIDLARGRIHLNIELKYYGKDPRLAPDVARLLHDERFEDQCLVMSLAFDGPAEAHAANPAVRTGAIVTVALGDISRLQADVLSVNAQKLTGSLLRSARRHGKGVHVWTVDQEKTALRLMQRGVDNIITNDPATAAAPAPRVDRPAGRCAAAARLAHAARPAGRGARGRGGGGRRAVTLSPGRTPSSCSAGRRG